MGIWAEAHADRRGDDRLRDVFVRGVLRVVDPIALTMGVPLEGQPISTEGIPGDIGEVELVVARRSAALAGPEMVEAFVQTVLAPTLARLEAQRVGSREQRVDIAARPLGRARQVTGIAELAIALARYMAPQRDRSAGYYATLGNLGMLAFRPGDRAPSYFLAHEGLRGMMALAARDPELGRLGHRVVSTLAFNMAARIAEAMQDEAELSEGNPRATVKDLMRISTLSANEIELEGGPERGFAVASALGLEPASINTLTVVSLMSGVSAAWEDGGADIARLEASGGIILDATGDGRGAVSRLYNAAVSLNRSADSSAFLSARLAICALGMRLALRHATDLAEALLSYNGLQCAGNFIAAAEGYLDTKGPDAGVKHLASAIAALASWSDLELGDPGAERHLAVIGVAADRLGLTVGETNGEQMREAVEIGLGSLLKGAGSTSDGRPPDDANVVRAVFTAPGLAGGKPWGLLDEIGTLVSDREQESLAGILARYSKYEANGPFVPIGLVTDESWLRVEQLLLDPLDSIVPSLQAFSID